MVSIILVAGVASYFGVRISLWIKNKLSTGKVKFSKKNVLRWMIDPAIVLAVTFQLIFPQIGKMDLGALAGIVSLLGLVLFVTGIVFSNWGRLALGKNWRPAAFWKGEGNQKLVTSVPFSIMRHPIYVGMILVGFGLELALTNWLWLAIIPATFFLYLQAKSEEKALLGYFDQDYRDYQEKTAMFLPKIF